ncbi:hypothetical protein [Streptomyces sp. NPDC001415]
MNGRPRCRREAGAGTAGLQAVEGGGASEDVLPFTLVGADVADHPGFELGAEPKAPGPEARRA